MAARISQVAVEALIAQQSAARVAQVAVEVLSSDPAPQARVAQVAVEVLSVKPGFTSGLDTGSYCYVAALTAAIDEVGTEATYYVTDDGHGWVTRATDTPANTRIEASALDVGTYRREMFSGNAFFGAKRASFGVARLSNLDGRYDAWRFHGFDGRRYTVWAGPARGAFPGDFEVVFHATIAKLEVGLREVTITLRDDLEYFDRPVLTTYFAGTGGLEGEASAQGSPKPRMFGSPLYTPLTAIPLAPEQAEYVPTARYYSVSFSANGEPDDGDYVWNWSATLPVNVAYSPLLSPSAAMVRGGNSFPTYTYFDVFREHSSGTRVNVGTIEFAPGRSTGTFISGTPFIAGRGDIISVEGTSSTDPGDDVVITITGVVTTLPADPFPGNPPPE